MSMADTRLRVFCFLRRFIGFRFIWGLFRWDHGQYDMSRSIRAKVQYNLASEYSGRAIVEVIVHEGPAAAHDVLHVRQRCSWTVVFVISPADRERHAVATWNYDASGPDFDVQFCNFTHGE